MGQAWSNQQWMFQKPEFLQIVALRPNCEEKNPFRKEDKAAPKCSYHCHSIWKMRARASLQKSVRVCDRNYCDRCAISINDYVNKGRERTSCN